MSATTTQGSTREAEATARAPARRAALGATVTMVLAGGKGTRLGPLTCHRAKPALPFGGRYRLIDFTLSSLVNSGYRRVFVLTQYLATSLILHLNRHWRLSSPGEVIEVVPPPMRTGEEHYLGTADSVHKNLNLVAQHEAERVLVLGSDHVYTFAVDLLEQEHVERDADLSVATVPVPRAEAHRFGVLEVDAQGRVVGFEEKPRDPRPLPGQEDTCLASMGNYLFRADLLEGALSEDAEDRSSRHDFGASILPRLVREGARVFAYDFTRNRVPGQEAGVASYWRDVGTVDGYFAAQMDLTRPCLPVDLHNPHWPIRTGERHLPPARFLRPAGGHAPEVEDSLVAEGVVVQGARLARAVVGTDCRIQARAELEDAVVLSGCSIGEGARLRRVVLDENTSVEPGAEVGLDPEADRARFPFITPSGLIVLPKGSHLPRRGPLELAPDIAERLLAEPGTAADLQRFGGPYRVARTRPSHRSRGPATRRKC